LTNQPQHTPQLSIDGDAIIARLETLASAELCPRCERVIYPVAADAIQLFREVIRLHEGCIFLTCVTLGRYLINRLKFGVSVFCGLTGRYRW